MTAPLARIDLRAMGKPDSTVPMPGFVYRLKCYRIAPGLIGIDDDSDGPPTGDGPVTRA